MTSNVEVQNPAPAMLDYKEGIQQLEGQPGDSEEIEADDHLTMVSKKGEPAVGRITTAPQASQISGDRALGKLEAKLQKLPVDSRCAPARILRCHPANESANLLAHLRSPAMPPRSPAPIQTKACPMPSDHCFRFHNDQNFRPSRP